MMKDVRETSIEAFRRIEADGLLSPRRWAIYCTLFADGPMTANEIFRKLMGSTSITQSNIHARLGEMREMGCVKEMGTRACLITGNTAIVWDVTAKIPEKLSKERRDTCPTCCGRGYLKFEASQARLL